MNLLPLVLELPDRFRLTPSICPHRDGLDGSKVSVLYVCVLRTGVKLVRRIVAVEVSETSVAGAVVINVLLH